MLPGCRAPVADLIRNAYAQEYNDVLLTTYLSALTKQLETANAVRPFGLPPSDRPCETSSAGVSGSMEKTRIFTNTQMPPTQLLDKQLLLVSGQGSGGKGEGGGHGGGGMETRSGGGGRRRREAA